MRYRFTVDELEGLTVFLSEATEWVQSIAEQALRLQVISDRIQRSLVFEDLFYQLQMLKSRSLFWGLMDMGMLTCQAESMFKAIRSGQLLINPESVSLLGDITNTYQTMISELYQAIENIQKNEGLEIELACSQDVEWLNAFLQQLLQEKPSRALVVLPQTLVSRLPVIIRTTKVTLNSHPQYTTEKSSEDSIDSSSDIINTSYEVGELTISPSVTVTDEKLDGLLHSIGELTTVKNVFNKMSSCLMREYNLPNLSREAKAGSEFIQKVAAAMEDAVLSMRRVELGLIFIQFPHILKEIGSRTGKDICLTIAGEDVTVDKTIIQQLSNLLVTIICTMAKHSIESPAKRVAVGKEVQGKIGITAYSSGEHIVIEVEDDGHSMKGVDADAKVLEIYDLMARMNEVYHQRDAWPGNLEMISLPGEGNKIKITLPPSIMRCSGLLVEVSGELLLVPVENVVEIMRITTEQLVNKRGRQLLYHRGGILGILSLAEVLGIRSQQSDGSGTVVVVTNGQDKVGLMVHKLYSEQEIVVKSLPDYLRNTEYIKGAAVTSDNKVALILNVSALIRKN